MAVSTKKFGTLEGVFTPCLLSILGVIMYLRLGWVVGNVGFVGALIIICIANLITLATTLSMSSIVSNIRIGTGGAYSIIKNSLGMEAGGAIGFPLYIAQAISVAFYIAGFSECWLFVFPSHNVLLVSLILWFFLLVITYTSTKVAFRVQYLIMGLIGLSLVSIFSGEGIAGTNVFIQETLPGENFWGVFAVFFPAVTGILVGASMSGELKDPKSSIPQGTLWAIIISFCIYVGLAFFFAKKVPLADLQTNLSVAIDLGRWSWLVIIGIMGATLSSALGMFVGSPRILLALGKHSVVPFSHSFSRINQRGEPSAAILFTALLALITILLGTLNQIAVLLTMIFLITYGMINLIVFIEQSIGIISFRPSFRIARIIPLLGALGCGLVMFIINIKFSIAAIITIVFIYFVLVKREAQAYSPDIRSGTLVFLAEQLAKAANKLPYYPKIWKPNLLIPAGDINHFSQIVRLIKSIVAPSGRTTTFKVINRDESLADESLKESLNTQLSSAMQPLKDEGIFVETTVVQAPETVSGIVTVIQTLKGMMFPPNTFFYSLENEQSDDIAKGIITKAKEEGLGIIVLNFHPQIGLNQERLVNLWIRRQSPNINLAILMTLQLERNWDAAVRIIQVVSQESDREEARQYLFKLKDLMRLSVDVEIVVMVGEFKETLKEAPLGDINIFGMQDTVDLATVREVSRLVKTSVLFLSDSKHESALA